MLTFNGHDLSGTTAQRPTNAEIGQPFFDTTLGVDLTWNGTAWVTGNGFSPQAPGNGAAAGTGNVATESNGIVHRTVLTLTGLSVTMNDATTNGNEGSQKIYDFPEGNILILGATSNLVLTAGAGGITDTAAVVASVGTVAAGADATLTSTEANIIPSTSATLTGGVGTMAGVSTSSLMANGTQTPVDAILNIAVPDAGSTANDTISVTGTVTLVWVNLGDN